MITTTQRTRTLEEHDPTLTPAAQAADRVLARGRQNDRQRNGRGKHVSRETMPPAVRNTTLPPGIAVHDPEAGGEPGDGRPETAPSGLQPAAAPSFGWAGQPRLVPIADVLEDERNARQHYDPEALAGLAQSIREVGILQPLLVRLTEDGGYRVIAGHRRLRAAALAGLSEVPVLVRDCDDAGTFVAQALENLQREDLNAWEEAQTFRRLTQPLAAGGGGLSQADLARRLGCTPSRVSNALRLLELPAWCAAELQAGRMAATLGRETLRAAGVPAALEQLRKDWHRGWRKGGGLPDREEWARAIDGAIGQQTERVETEYHGHETHWSPVALRPLTDEERRRCDVRTFQLGGREVELAVNRKAYGKLRQERTAEAIAAAQQKARKKSAKSKANEKPLTAAEKKQQAAEAAQRAKQQTEALARRRAELRIDWLAWCCAERLREQVIPHDTILGACAVLLTDNCHVDPQKGSYDTDRTRREIRERFHEWLPAAICEARTLRHEELWDGLQNAVGHCLWVDESNEPGRLLSAELIETLVRDLGLDPAKLWAAGRKADPAQPLGPLTLRLWDLFTREELRQWVNASACDIMVGAAAPIKKTELIEALEGAKRLDPPAWLLGEKQKPAGKAKRQAKGA